MIVMAGLLAAVIVDSPGMSVTGWLFKLAPVVAIGIAVAVMSTGQDYHLAAFFRFSTLDIDKVTVLVFTLWAITLGMLIVLNPFGFFVAIFAASIIFLFLLSVNMIVRNKPIDAIGLLMLSFPLITYFEDGISGGTGFDLDWITVKIAIIMLFALIWTFDNFVMERKPFVKGKFNGLVLVFAAATFLSAVYSPDIGYSLKRWLFEIMYPISIYFIIVNSIRHEKDITKLLSYLIASVFLYLAMVLYYFTKFGGSGLVENRYALYLSFADGALVANVLIMVIPIVIGFLVTTHTRSLKLLLYSLTAMGFVGLMLSFSRMAQISMVIGLLAFCVNKKTRKYLMPVIAVGVFMLVFNLQKLASYVTKYQDLTTFEGIMDQSSLGKRYWAWNAALGMFNDHPVVGVGIGRFKQEYANYAPEYYAPYARGYVSQISGHNLYLTYLAETGIAGILLLITIFSSIVVKAFHLVKKADKNHVLKYSLLISVLIFLVNNLLDGITFAYVKEIDKGLVFWIITAIIMSYGAAASNKNMPSPDRARV